MAEIFLSYKREKKATIRMMADALARSGRTVFWDARLRASANYIQKLNQELMAANCVIVAWCNASMQSPWVMSECLKAYHRQILLPVKIEPINDHDIPAPFNTIHSLDLSNWKGNTDDSAWLMLEDDNRELLAKGRPTAVIVQNEADDADAMANELLAPLSGTARPVALVETVPAVDLVNVRAFIQRLVAKSGGSIPQATVATALRSKWPAETGQFNWFGHRRFSAFFKSLGFKELALDTSGPGSIKAKSNIATLPSPTLIPAQPVGHPVFATTDAPALSPAVYRAVIQSICNAIAQGATTVTDISRHVRDELASRPASVSRVKASFIVKGALIGGLNVKQRPLRPAMVALCYANSLVALCAASGTELTSNEQDQLLALIGFDDL